MMKNKLYLLYKTNLSNNYGINKWLKKKNISKNIICVLLYLLVFGGFLMLSGLYAYLAHMGFSKFGYEKFFIPLFYAISVIIIFMFTINKSKAIIFDSKDNDMLFAMPFNPKTILASKILSLLTMNYAVTIVMLLPAMVIYGISMSLSIGYYIMSLAILIFTPFIPVVLASLIGYFIAFISSRMKSGKKLVEIIFTFAFFVVAMTVSGFSDQILRGLGSNMQQIDEYIAKYGFVIKYVMHALSNNDMIALIEFILSNLLVFILFVAILSSSYNKIITKLKEVKTRKHTKEIKYVNSNIVSALTKKELKKIFTTPIYTVNMLFGVVLLVMATIATIVIGKDGFINMMSGANQMGDINIIIFPLITLMLVFVVTISNTACCSISLEGKNIWIIKSLPIKTEDIFKSKILANIISVLPITLICGIILSIIFNISFVNIILLVLLVTALSIAVSKFGIIINLLLPKLNFVSEVQVVKQSASSFICLFLPMIFSMIIMVLGVIVLNFISIELLIVALILVISMILIFETMLLKKWGKRAFNKLS